MDTVTAASTREIDDCWNRIGVAGDNSCPELQKVVHCRNCPVYSAAGRKLLERPAEAAYAAEWTHILAHAKQDLVVGTASVVIFRLGAEWLALPTHCFREISESCAVHRLPHRSDEVLRGLVNIRGEIHLCISLQHFLGVENKETESRAAADSARMVVVEKEGSSWVFAADEVSDICRYQSEDLKPVPATVSKGSVSYTRGTLSWQNKNVGCLDEELLFSSLNRRLS